MADNGVLFSRSKDNKNNMEEDTESDDNPWDDTLLIKAYDRAVNLAKANLAKKAKSPKENIITTKMDCTATDDSFKESKSKARQPCSGGWRIGSKCRAVWSHDGIEYEADIVAIKSNKNQARVKFVGYNNEENIRLNFLKPSHGEEARQTQIVESQADTGENEYFSSPAVLDHNTSQTEEGIMFPPPPPPHVLSYLPKDEQEALSAMLMSWYMSGYHTGYYQGLIGGRQNFSNKKK